MAMAERKEKKQWGGDPRGMVWANGTKPKGAKNQRQSGEREQTPFMDTAASLL